MRARCNEIGNVQSVPSTLGFVIRPLQCSYLFSIALMDINNNTNLQLPPQGLPSYSGEEVCAPQ
jgi:hypothetical protein